MGKKKRQVDRVFCCATKLTNQLQWTETLNPANSAYLQLEESTLFSNSQENHVKAEEVVSRPARIKLMTMSATNFSSD
ncbi:hypothetical protein SOVF_043960 [Spinacia oleracea]|nr:hypothetical protein SOVF_043960 [Spinacia oleracea]